MGALKILQNQFEQRSVEFPNMRGVWIQWKPISEATHSPIVISGGNIIDAWYSYGSGGCRYDSGLDMCHLLLKPEKSTWETDTVRDLFLTLAQKGWIQLTKTKKKIAMRSVSKAKSLGSLVERWLIVVHELLGSTEIAWDHRESNVIWEQGNSRIVWSPERDTTKPVCRMLDCVFLDSALACGMLLEQPKAKERKKDDENVPNDFITLLVAVKDYEVSRPTLKRAIADGRLKSERPPNAPLNAPHRVSRAEIEAIWPKRH